MVRFKGKMVERYHLTQVASTTDSGIEVRKWIVLLMEYLVNKGINKGSMLHGEEGKTLPIASLDVIFNEVL